MSKKQSPTTLADLLPWRKWVEAHGAAVFETAASFEWFVRTHPAIKKSSHWHELPQGNFISPGFEIDVMRELGIGSSLAADDGRCVQ